MSTLALPMSRPAADRSSWPLLLAAHAVLLTAVLVPLFSVETPPLADYPNHLARMHIMSAIERVSWLDSIYAVEWKALPNLAMDLLVPPLAGLLGADLACRLFLAACFALLAAGTALLHWSLYRRASAWPLVVYLFFYNHIVALGFLNFIFGTGLMLLCFALWIASKRWALWPRSALFGLLSTVLLFAHFGAFAAYGLCVLAYELGLALRGGGASLYRRGLALAGKGLQFAAPLTLLVLLSPSPPGDLSLRYDLWSKVRGLLSPVLFHQRSDEVVLFALLLAILLFLHARRWLAFHGDLLFPVVALALALLAVPTWLMDNWGNDLRIGLPLAAIFVAALSIRLPRRAGLALGAVFLVLLGYRVTVMTDDWRRYDALYAEFRLASAVFEPGSSVLPAADNAENVTAFAPAPTSLPFFNVYALSLLERPVFLPTLFTAEGRQILSVKPPYRDWDVPHSRPLYPAMLERTVDPTSAPALRRERSLSEHFHVFAGWPRHFDYVVMLDFGRPRNPLPDLLRVRHRGSFFTIYEVAAVAGAQVGEGAQ